MIGYFKAAQKPKEKSEYKHSAMYCGKSGNGPGSVTCHTASRFIGLTHPDLKDDWFLRDDKFSFTLLHIPRASESTANIGRRPLPVGGTITSASQSVFYFVRANGRAVRTSKAPANAKPPAVVVGAGDSRGYWFENHGKVTICWPAYGSLVTLARAGRHAQPCDGRWRTGHRHPAGRPEAGYLTRKRRRPSLQASPRDRGRRPAPRRPFAAA